MVGVTGQVQQVASSVVQRVRQRVAKGQKQDAGQIQGPGQTQHQGRVCKSGHPLNTPVSSVPGVSWLKG
ncbi:unnamed protein product [Staurois parvus]|uniref:Uncharacterized protein n=1 Tax=Staurois parvus TaxID=386267 RepID=A0ABN9F646_9NEOB|nr:unnamed protein product [Staurois parvus]